MKGEENENMRYAGLTRLKRKFASVSHQPAAPFFVVDSQKNLIPVGIENYEKLHDKLYSKSTRDGNVFFLGADDGCLPSPNRY
jgi:hypothetical protein